MTAYAFRRDAGEFAGDAWRPLDRAVYRWVIAHRGSTLLAQVAAWASLADGNGDTALPLAGIAERYGMPPLSEDDLAALRDEPMVDDGESRALLPFVLDRAERFYLRRNHAHECEVAALIAARRLATQPALVDESELDVLFNGQHGVAVQAQRDAVRQVPGRRLFVLTGGPGTGKTTTVLRMLAMLQRRSAAPLSMMAAAPTGKAAQRLVDALRRGRQQLVGHSTHPLPADWHNALATLPDTEALTLHRLLGFDPQHNTFRRNARHPLAADVVVVDEASMVDLAMLRALLDAIPSEATLILVGDADQLTSVAAGSVLMDLVAAMEARPMGDLVRLRHSFRAEQHLVEINEAVRGGAVAAFGEAIEHAGLYASHRRVDGPVQLAQELRRWGMRLSGFDELQAVAGEDDADRVLAALDTLARCQLLCALREDAFGAVQVNRVLEQHLRRAWGYPDSSEWYPGRAVIVTRNDYGARLFNGDVGLCLAGPDGQLRVWFETGDAARSVRSFAPGALPSHESAFAVTVHKSQGSEYSRVAVLLPPEPENRILSRQLLYTGVSRARQSVEVWASDEALAAALGRPVRRSGGLADRLLAQDVAVPG